MNIKGVNQMRAKLRRLAEKFPRLVESALYVEANIIMTKSKRLCPVAPDGGILRSSGMVHKPVRKGTNISVTMSYGGAANPYALAVHEHPSEYSPYSWRVAEMNGKGINWSVDGTGPKFLEQPINDAYPGMAGNLAARVGLDKLQSE